MALRRCTPQRHFISEPFLLRRPIKTTLPITIVSELLVVVKDPRPRRIPGSATTPILKRTFVGRDLLDRVFAQARPARSARRQAGDLRCP
jgi:hypothetical protein